MIDNSESWQTALLPDRRSLKMLTDHELKSMGAIERVSIWHGVSLGTARDMIGAELRRRTQTTERPEA